MKVGIWVLVGWSVGTLGVNVYDARAHSGYTLDVRYGTTPIIDGVLSSNEWDDAVKVSLLKDPSMPPSEPDTGAIVYLKHDTLNLYVAFLNNPNAYWGIHGVIVDLLDNGGTAPQRDDFWLYYDADNMVKREWVGDSSFWERVDSISDWNCESSNDREIEYWIKYTKLGITPGNPNLIGLHLCKGGAAPWEYVWPRHGEQNSIFDNPDTWGDANSSDNWTGIEESQVPSISKNTITYYSIFPNPVDRNLNILYNLRVAGDVSLKVYDIIGKLLCVLIEEFQQRGAHTVIWNRRDRMGKSIKSGVYFCTLEVNEDKKIKKIIFCK